MTGEAPSFDQIDGYVERLLQLDDPQLADALADARAAGLPAIEVSPVQGRLLTVLALAVGARRILELGTLGGYSSICLARALPPDGRMVTLELSERHAAVARGNLARAGLTERVEVRVGPAAAGLEALAAEGAPPFDLVFIDADKEGYPDYFRLALALTRPGGLILADNVLRRAAIPVPGEDGTNAAGIRSFNAMIAREHGQRATILPLAGRKGVDGMALVVVGERPA
jgi:predicted O-methyltransferase YrrM